MVKLKGAAEEDEEGGDGNSDGKEKKKKKKRFFGRLRELWQRYGYVAIGTYVGLYAVTFGGSYLVFSTNLVEDLPLVEHVLDFMQTHLHDAVVNQGGNSEQLDHVVRVARVKMETEPNMRHGIMAFCVTEIVGPVRDILTLALTAPVARALGYAPRRK